MNLLVDMGNTRFKWELRNQQTIVEQGAALHVNQDLFHLLDAQWSALAKPEAVWIGSVASPQKTRQMLAWAQGRWDITPTAVHSTASIGPVRNAYTEPATLGVDRWLALLAAWSRHGRAACIVDCGTAVTLDTIDDQARHLGGSILPGLLLMQQSVINNTHQVRPVSAGEPVCFAHTTADALQSGATLAVIGAINAFTETVMRQFPQAALLITGGDAALLQPRLAASYQHIPNLVLDGLAVLAASP